MHHSPESILSFVVARLVIFSSCSYFFNIFLTFRSDLTIGEPPLSERESGKEKNRERECVKERERERDR